MSKFFRRLPLVLVILTITFQLSSQESSEDGFYLFNSDEVLNVTLKFDLTEFVKKKYAEEYLDAVMIFHFDSGDSIVNKIGLRSRGNSRKELCIVPPIRLNFKDCDNKPLDLMNATNVKLVTHCKDNNNYEDYVLKEYLAYKLYNVVTDTSFKVRAMKIRYEDTGKKGWVQTRFGFVLEPVDELKDRLNAEEKEDIVMRTRFVDNDNYDKLCMFQYMIGNDDWYLANQHNLKLIVPREGSQLILSAVPYDFDYSGLVDAYYAIPNAVYGLTEIRDRVYVGPCRTDERLHYLMQFFLDRKSQFYDEIEKVQFVNDKMQKKVTDYIESFFDEYKRDQLFYNIKRTCTK